MELLFDEIERTETRPKIEQESIYTYYNLSARKPLAALRGLLQQWFDSYPHEARNDLLGRFRSKTDSQHKSAFWELYLHELFTRMDYKLECHPTVARCRNHPDYLVSEAGEPRFYLEATLAGLPSDKNAGAEARRREVFAAINQMKSTNYTLMVEHRGVPSASRSTGDLQRSLTKWLDSLDYNEIEEAWKSEGFDGLPQFNWPHDGLTLVIKPVPKCPSHADGRAIGMSLGEAYAITTDKDIRDALENKANKYGELSLPLVVAVNVVSEHCDDIDINNALFGSETVQVTQKPDGLYMTGPGKRKPNGVWFGKNGARNRHVSAVLIGNSLDPYTAGTSTPELIHNPYTAHRLELSPYPLPESIPNGATCTMQKKKGRNASEFLRLPSPWPPSND